MVSTGLSQETMSRRSVQRAKRGGSGSRGVKRRSKPCFSAFLAWCDTYSWWLDGLRGRSKLRGLTARPASKRTLSDTAFWRDFLFQDMHQIGRPVWVSLQSAKENWPCCFHDCELSIARMWCKVQSFHKFFLEENPSAHWQNHSHRVKVVVTHSGRAASDPAVRKDVLDKLQITFSILSFWRLWFYQRTFFCVFIRLKFKCVRYDLVWCEQMYPFLVPSGHVTVIVMDECCRCQSNISSLGKPNAAEWRQDLWLAFCSARLSRVSFKPADEISILRTDPEVCRDDTWPLLVHNCATLQARLQLAFIVAGTV